MDTAATGLRPYGTPHFAEIDLAATGADAYETGGPSDGDIAAEHLAKTLGNGESKPGTAILPSRRRVGLAEGLEEPALLLLGHADTGIADDKRDFGADRSHLELDSAFVGEFAGIAQQVEKALLELGPVGVERSERRRADDLQTVCVRRRQRLDDRAHLLDEDRKIDLLKIEVHLAGLDLRQIEDVVDQP